MRQTKRLLVILTSLLLGLAGLCSHAAVGADATNAPSLVISLVKITASNGQLVVLYNASDSSLDMSRYQLVYFNSFDLTKATSSKLVSLNGAIPPHSYYVISDATQQQCYQATVASMSLGFSSTAGMVEVLGFVQTSSGLAAIPSMQDYIAWSKTAATGVQTLPTSSSGLLLRQPVDSQRNPQISTPGSGSWLAVLPDPANACGFVLAANTTTAVSTSYSLGNATQAPAAPVIDADTNESVSGIPTIPQIDEGLKPPLITELLPNPSGTGNDKTDEFIEVFNPNDQPFDLSGFVLIAGNTTLKPSAIANGTIMQPHQYLAFYSSKTGLSLSNSGGQVELLDPLGSIVSAADRYTNADDGLAWANNAGVWVWTTKPTPGAPNVNVVPAAKTNAKSAKQGSATTTKSTKSPSTKKLTTSVTGSSALPTKTAINLWVLALVATGALVYGAYEYRTDLGNYFTKLRRYRPHRQPDRLAASRR